MGGEGRGRRGDVDITLKGYSFARGTTDLFSELGEICMKLAWTCFGNRYPMARAAVDQQLCSE